MQDNELAASEIGRVPAAPGSREPSPSVPLVSAASGFDPSREAWRDIPWHLGSTDESYGTMVWTHRIDSLRGHLRIIRDYMPEEAAWLLNQVNIAIEKADSHLRDWSPLSDSDGSPKGGDGEAGSVRSTTARAEGIAPPSDRNGS